MKENIKNEDKIYENIEEIDRQFKNKKQIPKKNLDIINKKVFENIIIAIIVLVYSNFLNLGALNIETNIYIVDLKVFTMALIILTIVLFELSYKKENTSIFIHSIETFLLSLFTMIGIYVYKLYFEKYEVLVAFVGYVFAIYYVLKATITYIKLNKEYKENLNDINEIIKK